MIQTISIEKLNEFQRVIQKFFPEKKVIIAGGAPRDILHGKKVKDIVVFIESKLFPKFSIIEAIGDMLHTEPTFTEDNTAYNKAFEVVNYDRGPCMLPVQLIFPRRDPVQDIKETFDYGLCQVWLDGGRKIHTTPAYWRDHNSKTFHFLLEGGGSASSDHTERLQAKYPEWRFQGHWELSRETEPRKTAVRPF